MTPTPEELERQADALLAEADEADILDRSDSSTISCKVGRKERIIIKVLSEKKFNCTINETLQMFLDSVVRYTDDRHNLSPELKRLIDLFEGFNWHNHINLVEPIERKQIMKAIYLMQQPGTNGVRMVMIEGSYDDLFRTATFNIVDIFDVFLSAYDERLYKEVQELAKAIGTNSLVDAIRTAIREYKAESEDDKTLRQMFEDTRKTDFGKEMADAPYKRTMTNSMDTYEARLARFEAEHQLVIQFE